MMGTRVTILDVGFDPLTIDEVIAACRRFIRLRKPSLVWTVNVDGCMKARRNAEFRMIINSGDLVLVDGTPMMWAARLLGSPLPDRVSGSDFVPAFCSVAAREGYGIFLLGGAPGVPEAAKCWLELRNPGLNIVGTCAPPLGFEHDQRINEQIIESVRERKPDVLLVALGQPRQERWLFRFRDTLGVPMAMNVGSTFDYLADRLQRAPAWVQRAGLEWTYRLAQDPCRLWRRYLIDDSPFVYHVLRQRLQIKRPGIVRM